MTPDPQTLYGAQEIAINRGWKILDMQAAIGEALGEINSIEWVGPIPAGVARARQALVKVALL